MCQLPDHLPARSVLNDQRVFSSDPGASRNVRHLYDHRRFAALVRELRDTTLDNPVLCMHLCRPESQLVGISATGIEHTQQNIPEFGVIIDKRQQWFARGAVLTDTKQVFCCRVEVVNQQVFIR
jgi:hypothetical protein